MKIIVAEINYTRFNCRNSMKNYKFKKSFGVKLKSWERRDQDKSYIHLLSPHL